MAPDQPRRRPRYRRKTTIPIDRPATRNRRPPLNALMKPMPIKMPLTIQRIGCLISATLALMGVDTERSSIDAIGAQGVPDEHVSLGNFWEVEV